MFNWRKSKKKDKPSNSGAQAQTKKNDDVTFHTMQDDLAAPRGKITADKWERGETEKRKGRIRTEIRYDKKEDTDKDKEDADLRNPFLGNVPSTPKSFDTLPKSPEAVQDKGRQISSAVAKVSVVPKTKRGIILKIFTFLLAMAAISLGAYFFWVSNNQVKTPQAPAAPETQDPAKKTTPAETSTEKYSSENPNYLSINTESASSEDIAQLLIQTASEIKEFKSDGPFEFIVTDANNNPLSFSIFAYLSKINLSSETLNSLGESFSLYFYTDNENVRLGITANIQDMEAISSEMSGEESALAGELRPLFLGSAFSKTGKSFNTSQYKNFQIRYINLNEENTLSVDYSIIENQLVIGTSKNTTRAIIDEIEQDSVVASEEENENTDMDDDADIEL